ncbi:MAG TPA: hypothetical protein VGB53_00120 [Rubricoccaceae bacterium]|jgi:uncharacterized membrane protein YciS (DUF1049 family)
MRALLFLLLITVVVGFLLATQGDNATSASFAIPFSTLKLSGPIYAMLTAWFGAGALTGYLVTVPGRFGAAARARRAEKQLASVETTNASTVSAVRADAAAARANAAASSTDAAETQRLADEVARGMARRDVPPPRNL